MRPKTSRLSGGCIPMAPSGAPDAGDQGISQSDSPPLSLSTKTSTRATCSAARGNASIQHVTSDGILAANSHLKAQPMPLRRGPETCRLANPSPPSSQQDAMTLLRG